MGPVPGQSGVHIGLRPVQHLTREPGQPPVHKSGEKERYEPFPIFMTAVPQRHCVLHWGGGGGRVVGWGEDATPKVKS